MKKLAVIIAALISFLSFSTFSFAQGVMTNTEIDASKKSAKKTKKTGGPKSKKGNQSKSKKTGQPKHKRVKPVELKVEPKKAEDQTPPQKTNP